MTSTLTLYKDSELTPEHNYIIDSVEGYLLNLQNITINNFQHIKHGLDLKIKVALPQTEVSQPTYNYAAIKICLFIYLLEHPIYKATKESTLAKLNYFFCSHYTISPSNSYFILSHFNYITPPSHLSCFI